VSAGLSAELTKLDLFSDSPPRLLSFQNYYGNEYSFLIGTAGWYRDTRDSAIWTTRGRVQRVSGEVTLPVGDLRYYKFGYETQWFFPLSQTFTMLLRGDLGIGEGMGGDPLPFFKNYFAGGVTSVRGFNTASLGPRDPNDNSVIGGNRRIVGGGEVLFPMPGMGQDRSVRMSLFVDGGQVFGPDEKVSLSGLRYAAGLSVSWNSPVGPLKFSVAQPLNEKPGDNIQRLQFTLGQVF
jgi:outer membrane protein insertion porin family